MTFKMFNHRWGRDHSEAIQNWVRSPSTVGKGPGVLGKGLAG